MDRLPSCGKQGEQEVFTEKVYRPLSHRMLVRAKDLHWPRTEAIAGIVPCHAHLNGIACHIAKRHNAIIDDGVLVLHMVPRHGEQAREAPALQQWGTNATCPIKPS